MAMMVLAAMTACTNDESINGDGGLNNEATTGASTYQVMIPASYGGEGVTRAVTPGTNGQGKEVLVSTFEEEDVIFATVVSKGENLGANSSQLKPDAEGKTANIVDETGFGVLFTKTEWVDGEFGPEPQNVPVTLAGTETLLLVNHGRSGSNGFDYTGQDGTVLGTNGLTRRDYSTATVTVQSVEGGVLTTTEAVFENAQSMFRFTFTGLPDGVGVASVTVHSAGGRLVQQYWPDLLALDAEGATTPGDVEVTLDADARTANGAGVVYAALRFLPLADAEATDAVSFTVTGTDGLTYVATKASPRGGFLLGKYYTATVALYPRDVNLYDVTQTDGNGVKYYAARDGQVLSGYFNDQAYVTIADGATVTLAGVNIQAPVECDHAAIHCLGDATIIVGHKAGAEGTYEDYNAVNAGDESSYPAVYVPAGKKLTISGTGELNADGENSNGAGIGGGAGGQCDGITVSGGTISLAQGVDFGAGIGSGSSGKCGNILISGGTIATARGGESAAGIGSGTGGQCGNITITDGISSVTATKGSSAWYIIGGYKCGTVTISGVTLDDDQLRSGVNGTIGNLTVEARPDYWIIYHQSNE